MPRRSSPLSPFAVLAVAGLCMSCVSAASGQGYVGREGRVLERDLRVGAGNAGLTPRASMAEEVRLRNALVTGNVGGLRSFRGNVGYTAPDDFRGSLGSDETYAFRRDAASSSIFSRPVRGGEGLRYQFYTATGMAARDFEEVGRLGATGTAAAKAPPGTAGLTTNAQEKATSLSQRMGTTRSTAAYDSLRDLSPAVVGYTQTSTGYSPITATSLLGVRTSDRAPLASRYPEVKEEKPRPGMLDSLQQPLSSPSSAPVVENQQQAIVEPVTRTLYEDLRERMKRQEEEAEANRPRGTPLMPIPGTPDAKPDATPDAEPATEPGTDPKTTPGEEETPQERADRRLQELRERLIPADKRLPLGENKTPALPDFEDETVDMLRRSGGQTGAFIDTPEGATLDPYARHMRAGQELLGKGKYFDAEERFANALAEKPGDVTAMAARMHAQLGAGLYLSGAINLKQLLVQAPEVAAMRYTGKSIPPPARLNSVAADLRANINKARDAEVQPSVGDSLLLAYVGWQLGDLAMADEGLTLAQKSADAAGKAEPLIHLLRRTWLEAPAKPGSPAGAKQPESPPSEPPSPTK